MNIAIAAYIGIRYTLKTQFHCWGSADVVYSGCGLAGVIIIKMCCARGPGVNQLIYRMLKRPRSSQSKREARVFLQLLKQVEYCSGKVAWDTTFSCLTALPIGDCHQSINDGIYVLMIIGFSLWDESLLQSFYINNIMWITILWIKYYMLNRIMIIPYYNTFDT